MRQSRSGGAGSWNAWIILLCTLVVGWRQAAAAQPPEDLTVARAAQMMEEVETSLLQLWFKSSQTDWVKNTYLTHDTEQLSAEAQKQLLAATLGFAKGLARFETLDLPAELSRKIQLLKTSLPVVAPDDPQKQAELARITTSMESLYAKGQYCSDSGECQHLGQLSRTLAKSRNPAELLEAWQGWRGISPPMRPLYERFVELANQGAWEFGFRDLGVAWRSGYDMPPERVSHQLEELWEQVRPLYSALHCYVRRKLAQTYGNELVPADQPIPAHLLGNMWSQSWGNIYPLVAPPDSDRAYDLTELLHAKKIDELEMVHIGERFFTSLGFPPLPPTFWERSQFTKPAGRDVVCHASAWNVDLEEDLRIKMCIEITGEDFFTIHHELGHNFYQRAYRHLSPLYRDSANDAFHEAIGDTVALSVTPLYLHQIGLLEQLPSERSDLGQLMQMALEKIAFLPFGLLVDQWRWQVFSGQVLPGRYNAAWWDLRRKYQGIAPPVPRSEQDFDPGAKYHVPFNTPYTRYFLAHILQFQFHRALAREAGQRGPLHQFSAYNNRQAGQRLIRMLEMGRSRPWMEALEVLTGETRVDASAIVEYFAPLKQWLDKQNEGATCGW